MKREVIKRCPVCNKLHDAARFYDKTETLMIYCSRLCYDKSRRARLECEYCGRIVELPKWQARRQRFCGKACADAAKKGQLKEKARRRKRNTANSAESLLKSLSVETTSSFVVENAACLAVLARF